MKTSVPEKPDAIAALRQLSLEQIEQRIAELDGERASLALLRRSLIAKRRAQDRAARCSVTKVEAQQ